MESEFATPPNSAHPETWFHLISGNVSKPALTADLEAVAGAGIQGIQLFHGSGRPWPGVTPQIQTLGPKWDDLISHVADETQRLGLGFTMQNCPGWAMSGGPWITVDNSMRHLVWSRSDVQGSPSISLELPQPQPSNEAWRDYRDVAVLAFPTPKEDSGRYLIPIAVKSNRENLAWSDLLQGKKDAKVEIPGGNDATWLELTFAKPTHLRSIELPPVELLMKRRNFDPNARIRVEAMVAGGWQETGTREIPRGTWQDRQPEFPLVLAFADVPSRQFRIIFESRHPLQLSYLRLSSAARVNDWRGQAGFALRSLERISPPVQDTATWLKSDSIIDLTDQVAERGKLTWDAPAGDWTVLRFGHVNTGVKNKPAPPEATGFECDKLSPAGAEQHFAGYIGRLSAPGGPADQGRLQGMLIDSWECYTQTWTPAMEKEFAARRGYELRRWLPAIAGYVVKDHSTSERFLRDWRKTISDMLVQNYFGRLADLARQRGMKLSFETAIGDVSPGDILEYYSKADIPMCEFWHPNDPHWGGLEAKPILPTASAAHIYGKPRIAAEAFTNIGLRWNEHPAQLKHLADRHFALGVNHLVFHTYTHNPRLDLVPGTSFGGRIGTPFIRGQTWWKHMPLFTSYLSRCQFMLQQGQPVADVLWYLGDDLDHKPRQDTPFPDGYRFDYLNFDALINRMSVVDGLLSTHEGVRWKVLWLPADNCERLTPATLERLQELLQDGATIVGGPPKQNPTLSGGADSQTRFDRLVQELWGKNAAVGRKPSGFNAPDGLRRSAKTANDLRVSPTKGDRQIGAGRLLWGDSLEQTLTQLGIQPDVVGAGVGVGTGMGSGAATWCHRRTDKKEIYFVAADRAKPLQANLRFRVHGRPEFWDPLTGTTKPITLYHQDDHHTTVPLDLPAAGSTFVVFHSDDSSNDATTHAVTRIDQDGTTLVDASDIDTVGGVVAQSTLGLSPRDELQPWVENPFAPFSLGNNGQQLLAWENGKYKITRKNRSTASITIDGTQSIPIQGPWQLSFPSGWDAPEQVDLPRLMPWSALKDKAARAFSGSATYRCDVKLDAPEKDTRLLLDLGRVAVIAEVTVNEKPVATLWAPPFRTDITPHVTDGRNHIEVTVTNTWYNRLVYDGGLPEAERKTWTYNRPHFKSELDDAGLIGPVVIRVGKIANIPSERQ